MDTAGNLLMEMQLFSFFAFLLWFVCGCLLYNQQHKWKTKQRKDDMFLDLEQDDDGDAQYLVSFFTGSGYKGFPTGDVHLHMFGSKYPGKYHCLTFHSANPRGSTSVLSTGSVNDEAEGDSDTYDQSIFTNDKYRHDQKGKKQFRKNCREKFIITEDVNLGRILKLVLETDAKGGHPYWECESVIVRDISTNEAWLFLPRCKIGWPPEICEPVTVEELTSFKRSWRRRIRREVRNGQYVFFGFWFRPVTSVYTFGQRICVALTCYFHLFCNCLLLLQLAFAPTQELQKIGGAQQKDKLDKLEDSYKLPPDADYWLAHVLVIGVVAAVTTSISGYILVTLFRQKSRYETRVEEMDYVIGTALDEHNKMQEKEHKRIEKTGAGTEQVQHAESVIRVNEAHNQEVQQQRKLETQETSVPFQVVEVEQKSQPEKAKETLLHGLYQKFAQSFSFHKGQSQIKDEELQEQSQGQQQPASASPPPAEQAHSKPKRFSFLAHDFSKFNPFAKKRNSSVASGSEDNQQHNGVFSRLGLTKLFSFGNSASNNQTQGESRSLLQPEPEIRVVNGEGRTSVASTHGNKLQVASRTESFLMSTPVEGRNSYHRRSTLSELGGRRVITPHELSPYEQREQMRKLFEGFHHQRRSHHRTQDQSDAEGFQRRESSLRIQESQSQSTIATASTTMTLQGARYRLEDLNNAELAVETLELDPNTKQEDLIPTRSCPQPILGWFAILILIVLPTAAILIWIVPEMIRVAGSFQVQTSKLVSTYIAALYVEVFVVETTKIGLLAVYYAYTDKTMYKKILHKDVKSRIFLRKRKKKNLGTPLAPAITPSPPVQLS